jgi:hypothetical protein
LNLAQRLATDQDRSLVILNTVDRLYLASEHNYLLIGTLKLDERPCRDGLA